MPKPLHSIPALHLIRTRLTLWIVLILAVGMIVFVVTTLVLAQSLLQQQNSARLRQNVSALSVSLAQESAASPAAAHELLAAFSSPDIYLQYQNPQGIPITGSANMGQQVLPLAQLRAAIAADHVVTLPFQHNTFAMYGHRVVVSNHLVGYIIAAQTAADHTTMRLVLTLLYSGGGLMLAVIMVLVWLLIRRMLHPLEKLADSASHIAETSDHALRLQPQRRADEIGSLAGTINCMLDSLEEAYQHVQETTDLQRRFLADVAHELRTPLTIMLSSLDLMKQERGGDVAFQRHALADIHGEAERMSRLVTRLLMLARTDTTVAVVQEPLLIVDMIREVCQECCPPDRTMTIDHQELATLEDAVVLGNADYLKQVLLIVVENACKYTTTGGTVTVREEVDDHHLHISVIDTGMGIAAEDQPHLFQRFYRAANARMLPGMGLGLSIAKSILDQHHGSISVESTLGQGSRFCISLPLLNE